MVRPHLLRLDLYFLCSPQKRFPFAVYKFGCFGGGVIGGTKPRVQEFDVIPVECNDSRIIRILISF